MKMKQVLVILVGLILISVSGIADDGEKILVNVKVPLPDDIKITAPAADVPEDIAAFSGVWEGKWNHFNIEAALIVEEINSKEAKVILCEGEQSGFYAMPASCERYNSIVTPENLQIEFGPIEKIRYTFSMENNLNQAKVTIKNPGFSDKGIMNKIISHLDTH